MVLMITNSIRHHLLQPFRRVINPSIRTYLSRRYALSAHSTPSGRLPTNDQDHQIIQAAKSFIKAHELTGSPSLDSWSDLELVRKRKRVDLIRSGVHEWERLSKLASELQLISTSDPDPDMRQIAFAELESLGSSSPSAYQQPTLCQIRSQLLQALFPTPHTHRQSALVEIKPGVGGVEAAHFATSLMNIYTRHALRQKWRVRPVNVEWMASGQGMDGLREAILEIEGEEVYGRMRWEAGVHRVQRVPVMQNTSAVHTSTAAVIVLPLDPENQDPSEEVLFEEKDVRMETMRSQGAGGQHVNKTESAVRLTHVPTGIVVSMQDSRSQHQNRARAFMILRARLSDLKSQQKQIEERGLRLSQVKTSDRNQKIRTYNFQQGRVTDHRIGLTLPRLHDLMEGGETLESIWSYLAESEMKQSIDSLIKSPTEQ
ncbi:hypothetical protein CROQUDRAFT_665457 [Cronartium quercuum f. sp. fusiforme G11]|uniref:Prokaryotic-type class I peptide chain release factors domain-containing protein n=1 Tax=Cronartium quercuum f. sp. fusiforme G11 TaxID=708437 RepID=A0A9P6T5Y6_9BASI|nr:hypothetical protein CROQUDRAFT_665457 [Cronartium quercuum f. sp. fusiforme G11]